MPPVTLSSPASPTAATTRGCDVFHHRYFLERELPSSPTRATHPSGIPFKARDAVRLLTKSGRAETEEDAIEICDELLQSGLIVPVKGETHDLDRFKLGVKGGYVLCVEKEETCKVTAGASENSSLASMSHAMTSEMGSAHVPKVLSPRSKNAAPKKTFGGGKLKPLLTLKNMNNSIPNLILSRGSPSQGSDAGNSSNSSLPPVGTPRSMTKLKLKRTPNGFRTPGSRSGTPLGPSRASETPLRFSRGGLAAGEASRLAPAASEAISPLDRAASPLDRHHKSAMEGPYKLGVVSSTRRSERGAEWATKSFSPCPRKGMLMSEDAARAEDLVTAPGLLENEMWNAEATS